MMLFKSDPVQIGPVHTGHYLYSYFKRAHYGNESTVIIELQLQTKALLMTIDVFAFYIRFRT